MHNDFVLMQAIDHPFRTASCLFALVTLAAGPARADQHMAVAHDATADVPLATQRLNDFTNEVEFKVRWISDDAVKFGEYNSLEQETVRLDGSFDIEKRDYENGTARYYSVWGKDVGTNARELVLATGKQDSYDVRVSYDQMERQTWGSFKTPYDLSYPPKQTLPRGFPDMNSGDPLRALPFVREHGLSIDRQNYGIAYIQHLFTHWTVKVDLKREEKEGFKDYGLRSPNRFAPLIFAYPIDYTNDKADVSVEFNRQAWHARLAYNLSNFDNLKDRTTLDDPYTLGQHDTIAQEPDNLFQQLSFDGLYRLNPGTTANWFLGYSVGEQDETLLPMSANEIVPTVLTRAKAGAKVATTIARLGVNSRITSNLRTQARLKYRKKNTNTTPYDVIYLRYDSTAPGPATSNDGTTPLYDTAWKSLEVSADYRLPWRFKLKGGYTREEIQRPGQDVTETEEDQFWAGLKAPMFYGLSNEVEYRYSDREGNANNPNAIKLAMDFAGNFNPLFFGNPAGMQRFNWADRNQHKVKFRSSYAILDSASLGLTIQQWVDDHDEAAFGLKKRESGTYTVDFGYRPSRVFGAGAYAGMQTLDYKQRSQQFGGASWIETIENATRLAGVDFEWEVLLNRLSLKAGYRFMDDNGDISGRLYNAAGALQPSQDLPNLDTTIHHFELEAEYFVNKNLSVVARGIYEDYQSDNWAFDDIGPVVVEAPTAGYLAGGMESPNHEVGLVEVGFRIQF